MRNRVWELLAKISPLVAARPVSSAGDPRGRAVAKLEMGAGKPRSDERTSGVRGDPDRADRHLEAEIPHRGPAERLLLEALPERVERFLDLGSGDGRLLRTIRGRHPHSRGLGLEVSAPMLARAAKLCGGDPAIKLRRHDLAKPLPASGPYDAVVSSLAIHEVEDRRKRALFAEVHDLLRPGGVFANLDLVRPGSPQLHRRFLDAVGLPGDDPADRRAGLVEQLEWLEDAGFAEVDCRFKWFELALIVGQTPS